MLDKIKKLLSSGELPAEVTPFYAGARNEREALLLLQEARRRDEARRRRAIQDLEVLDKMETDLLEQGKEETSDNRRLLIARKIKEVRGKAQELNSRIENIYNKRLRVFGEHVQSLETILELSREALPDKKSLEEMAIKARQLLEDLEKTRELAEGIAQTVEKPVLDAEESEILKELEMKRDLELEAEGPATDKPAIEKKRPDREAPRKEYEE